MGQGRVPVKIYTHDIEEGARKQLANVAALPFLFHHVAVMPDVHVGIGAVVGAVIPTKGAVVPAAVGVDIGCGMTALPLDLTTAQLGDTARDIRLRIEEAVPHGRTDNGGRNDRGAWGEPPPAMANWWRDHGLQRALPEVVTRHPGLLGRQTNTLNHLGTLGTGNHFIEICHDEAERLWIMLHSGSRGIGNRIGTYFIEQARRGMARDLARLPDRDLAWLTEGSETFADYVAAVNWAQGFAKANRRFMLERVLDAVSAALGREIRPAGEGIDCHHNYLAREVHFDRSVWITRKGAIRAGVGELGLIPGSMGARSFVVRGLGNTESFCSCSHGAGRRMSRSDATRRFTPEDLERQTAGVECRKDRRVLDEIPGAYKDIDQVMANQDDLVEVVHTLKQVVCVKG
ncbi:MAG: RtcB family protein [Magnetococcales bacterium]|nr:RtcB family protein [Magnetococcales bacterium]